MLILGIVMCVGRKMAASWQRIAVFLVAGIFGGTAQAAVTLQDIEDFSKIAEVKGVGKLIGAPDIQLYGFFSGFSLMKKDFKLVFAERLCAGEAVGEEGGMISYSCDDESRFKGRFSCAGANLCQVDVRDQDNKRYRYNITLKNSIYAQEMLSFYSPPEKPLDYAALVSQQAQMLAGVP